ncbi:hypothetical protein PQR57_10060 [Paraburkholderia dipogonis]|uniref:Uncharacterized protein n=1 Tax=Paraburkholderia dipogonis TaxID=1211383 RepID=A0ABW9AMB3_9BURK
MAEGLAAISTGASGFRSFNLGKRINMSHHQLEKDLAHLEHILPQLVTNNVLGLVYWRQRITALETAQTLLPGSARRVTRLRFMFDQIDSGITRL